MSIIKLNNIKSKKNKDIENNKIKKSSGIIEKSLIQYINEGFSADFEKIMKRGYQEMAEINLEYSNAIDLTWVPLTSWYNLFTGIPKSRWSTNKSLFALASNGCNKSTW